MRKRDITLILIMLIGAVVVAIIPQTDKVEKEIHPNQLIAKATHINKYISTYELANSIMMKDPSIVLVDIRSEDEFNKFSLYGAMNIPLNGLLVGDNIELFEEQAYTYVLYSNGSLNSSKAWLILVRMGFQNIRILDGGLNMWVETILQPKPLDFMSTPDMVEQHKLRIIASRYFGKASLDSTSAPVVIAPAPAPIVRRAKKESSGGGCD